MPAPTKPASSTVTTQTVPIKGMTCRSCEVRLTKKIARVKGVQNVNVNLRTASAVVTGTAAPADVHAAILSAGYAVGTADWLNPDRRVWHDLGLAGAGVAFVAALALSTGLTDLSSRVGGTLGSGSLLIAVLLGLAAGFSTCMALVGGIVLSVAARHAERHPNASGPARMRPHLAFNAGRIVGFTALGAVIGAAGSAVQLSGPAMGIALGIAGTAMLIVGLQLTTAFPRLGNRLFVLPPALSARLGLGRGQSRYSDGTAFAAGAGSFFLPCGFTQAVQLYALASGSPVKAAALLGLFALGTTPGLLGLGGIAARGTSQRFFRFAGVVVVAFALFNLTAAVSSLAPNLNPFGSSFAGTSASGSAHTLSSNVTVLDGAQIMTMTQDGGYSPADSVVYAGLPVHWKIDSRSVGCDASLQAPAQGVHGLKPGLNEFTFTPAKLGRIAFACSMGMYRGSITVIPAPSVSASPAASPARPAESPASPAASLANPAATSISAASR